MSDSSASAFSSRTIFLVVAAGLASFILFLVLTAYAPELRSGRDGRAHSLSTSAVGFRGVYELLDATGAPVDYVRDENVLADDGLTIVTLEMPVAQERLDALLDNGEYQPTLIVLPKWFTRAIPGERDRVEALGPPALGGDGEQAFASLGDIVVTGANIERGDRLSGSIFPGVQFRAPTDLQLIAGKALDGLITTDRGDIVLANVRGTEIYILSDPDLLNNQALASPQSARAALVMLQVLNADGGPYRFELAVNGFGANQANLLTLAFEPPFLALTLSILAAALLAGLHAAFRFGPPLREPRAIAFGKRALVDNSAELLRLARREHLSSKRYAAITREAAVTAIGNPRQLSGAAIDNWLDGFDVPGSPPFSALAARAERATARQEILDAARALNLWKRTIIHES